MNKKGSWGEIIFAIIVFFVVIFFAMNLLSANGIKVPFSFSSETSGTLLTTIKTISQAVYTAVAPVGMDENKQMIAFGMFLLILVIGTKAFKNFFNGVFSFIIAAIIGLIASRSLNSYIIEHYISGSPVASGAFLIGVLPILAAYGIISKWGRGAALKMTVWSLLAVTYLLVFMYGFNETTMGWVYFLFILLAGLFDAIWPTIKAAQQRKEDKQTGEFIGKAWRARQFWKRAEAAAPAGATAPETEAIENPS